MDWAAANDSGAVGREAFSATQALRLLPAGVLVAKAPDGEIVYMNEYGRTLAGGPVTGRRLRGTCLVQRIDGRPLEPSERPLSRAFSGEKVSPPVELRLQRCHTGEWVHVRVSAAPIHDRSATCVIGAVLCFEDIAPGPAGEEARRSADRHRDEFMTLLAHELANPLDALGNALDVVARAPHDPVVVDSTRALMQRQVSQITRVVGDLRELARIKAGKLGLDARRLDLRETVRSAVEAAEPLMQARHHRLELALPEEPVWVHADRDRLARALYALLANAARYTLRPGTVGVFLTAEERMALVQVLDTGVGIPRAELDSIFELYRHGTAHHRPSGVGLGLHLCRRLVELHGGSVAAFSEGSGHGSRFVVRLPLAPQ